MKTAIILLCTLISLFILLTVLYILSLRTEKRRDAGSRFASVNYAHRGYHKAADKIPENSTSAFNRAIENGYGIELDVQLSKDGVPMVFHDYTLNRMCGIDGRVDEYTKAELQTFPLLGVKGQTIPSFEEVLKLVNGQVPLLVEIKAEVKAIETTEKTQILLDAYTGEYCIESFNPFVVQWYKKNRPQVIRGLLSDIFSRNKLIPNINCKHRILQSMMLNFLAKPDFVSYNYVNKDSLPFRLVKKIYNPYTFAWTPRDDEAAAECFDFNCMIFENITL